MCRPTLVSFATAIGNTRDVQSPEFKKANSSDVLFCAPTTKNGLPEIGSLIAIYKTVEQMIDGGQGSGRLPPPATAVWPRHCSRCVSATMSAC